MEPLLLESESGLRKLDVVALEDEAFAVSSDEGILVHVNATGRQVLEAVRAGASLRDVSMSMAEAGAISPGQAWGDVEAFANSIGNALQTALRRPEPPSPCAPQEVGEKTQATYCLFERNVTVRFPSHEAAATCRPLLAPFEVAAGQGDQLTAVISQTPESFSVHCGLAEVQIARSKGALMTALQRAILCHDEADPGLFDVAVHAGAIVGRRGAWLIGGESGRGKSTLVMRLDATGHRVLSDDVVPLDLLNDAALPMATGLSVKAGSWETAARLRSDVVDVQPCISPVGKRVKYLKPLNPATDADRAGQPVAGLLLPRHTPGASPSIRPVGLKEAMIALCDRFGRFPIDPVNLERLIALLGSKPRYELTYNEIDDLLPELTALL